MKTLRILLVVMFLTIVWYTGKVLLAHGFGLFDIFISDLAAINWSGQFNLDFSCYLLLSALWLAWRSQFSTVGIVLALLASVAGIMFFAPYLLYLTILAKGDMRVLLIGNRKMQSATCRRLKGHGL